MRLLPGDLAHNVPERYRNPRRDKIATESDAHFSVQDNFSAVVLQDRVTGSVRAVGQTKRRPDDDIDMDRAFTIAFTRAYNQL